MYFLCTKKAGNIFNGKLSPLHCSVVKEGQRGGQWCGPENVSSVTNLCWFWKWDEDVVHPGECKDGWKQSSADFPPNKHSADLSESLVRAKKNRQSIPNMKQLSEAEIQEMAPSWNVKPSRTPLEDRWLAVRISLRLADHHTEHADSLWGPAGGLWEPGLQSKGRRGEWEWRGGHQELLYRGEGCENEGSAYDQLQQPSTELFIAFLITMHALSAHMSHFHKWSLAAMGVWSTCPFLWLKHMF